MGLPKLVVNIARVDNPDKKDVKTFDTMDLFLEWFREKFKLVDSCENKLTALFRDKVVIIDNYELGYFLSPKEKFKFYVEVIKEHPQTKDLFPLEYVGACKVRYSVEYNSAMGKVYAIIHPDILVQACNQGWYLFDMIYNWTGQSGTSFFKKLDAKL